MELGSSYISRGKNIGVTWLAANMCSLLLPSGNEGHTHTYIYIIIYMWWNLAIIYHITPSLSIGMRLRIFRDLHPNHGNLTCEYVLNHPGLCCDILGGIHKLMTFNPLYNPPVQGWHGLANWWSSPLTNTMKNNTCISEGFYVDQNTMQWRGSDLNILKHT